MKTVAAFLLLLALTPAVALAGCRAIVNERVALIGTMDDPDVFVWDSRFRLRDYEGGTFDQRQVLLPHALLAHPGTRATVESCVSNFVQPKYEERPEDAVGIVITSGPLRGERGWVLGSAVRRLLVPRRWRFYRPLAHTRGPDGVSTRSTAMP